MDKREIARYVANYKAEFDAITLYGKLKDAETNSHLKKIYGKLALNEQKHAAVWAKKLKEAGVTVPHYTQGWRTRILGFLVRILGPSAVLPTLAGIEKKAATGYDGQKDAEKVGMPQDERSHARVFGYLADNSTGLEGNEVARFEGRHKGVGGNALRAGVLGANDGLVSVFSLIMGVAGAGVSQKGILISGFAGMLAGALSMALGEWLSVQNSRELYENQIAIEKLELEESPQEEAEELALIYEAKGMDAKSARKLAKQIISNSKTALETLTREELGIDPKELGGSAWVAAGTSFLLFTVGAIIPLFPFLFCSGMNGILTSLGASVIGLFVIGAFITLITGKNALMSGLRQVIIGLVAAGITFGIGRLIGMNIGG